MDVNNESFYRIKHTTIRSKIIDFPRSKYLESALYLERLNYL